jgi:hypothetical protein
VCFTISHSSVADLFIYSRYKSITLKISHYKYHNIEQSQEIILNINHIEKIFKIYKGVSKSFRTGRLERELQMVQLCATMCSCIAILWVSLVSSVAITVCVASQRVFVVDDVYFVTTQSGNFWIHPRKMYLTMISKYCHATIACPNIFKQSSKFWAPCKGLYDTNW